MYELAPDCLSWHNYFPLSLSCCLCIKLEMTKTNWKSLQNWGSSTKQDSVRHSGTFTRGIGRPFLLCALNQIILFVCLLICTYLCEYMHTCVHACARRGCRVASLPNFLRQCLSLDLGLLFSLLSQKPGHPSGLSAFATLGSGVIDILQACFMGLVFWRSVFVIAVLYS